MNSLKHGLTGAGVVLPEADAAEVDRRSAAFAEELNATGEVGLALARRAALNSVRMERAADQQAAALSERVRRVEAEFVAPEGLDADEAGRLRAEACRRAMFDPSKEATLARRYEAAAERGFLRCLKDLNQRERASKAGAEVEAGREARELVGSFLQMQKADRALDADLDAMEARLGLPPLQMPVRSPYLPPFAAEVDLPITVGKRP